MNDSCTFITWYPSCRRSDGIAEALDGPSHLISYIGFKKPAIAPLKYIAQAATTAWTLLRERPRTVLVASPPFVATLPCLAYTTATSGNLVIDAHTGIFDDPKWRWALPIQRWLVRRARAVIVTNQHLADIVTEWGGVPIILGTVPLSFDQTTKSPDAPNQYGLVVSTFADDEPLDLVFAAATSLAHRNFIVTGDSSRMPAATARSVPDNVTFPGWVSDDEYAALLVGASYVVCLTTRDHTMQRGGYEAMAAGKPLITSHWPILRKTFDKGTIHINNSEAELLAAIERIHDEHTELSAAMESLSNERAEDFRAAISSINRLMSKEES